MLDEKTAAERDARMLETYKGAYERVCQKEDEAHARGVEEMQDALGLAWDALRDFNDDAVAVKLTDEKRLELTVRLAAGYLAGGHR